MSVAWIGEIESGPGAFLVISGTEDRDRLDQHRATVDVAAARESHVVVLNGFWEDGFGCPGGGSDGGRTLACVGSHPLPSVRLPSKPMLF